MKAQHILTIVAIADAGSIRKAAEILGKSQPALTKALYQAEEDIGVPLFQRTSRGVLLTEWGERVLARSRIISNEINKLGDEIKQLRGEQVGAIHIGVSPFTAVSIIPQALKLFRQTHPKIAVRISNGLFPGGLKPLREGRTDMIIGPTPPKRMQQGLTIEPILETPIVIVTSKGSRYEKARSLSNLCEAEWVMIGEPDGPGDIFEEFFQQNNLIPPKALITSESYLTALSLLENLGAVCTFPQRLLETFNKNSSIVKIDLAEKLAPLGLSLMTRSGHPLTPAAYQLSNCIRRRAISLTSA